MIEPTWVHRRGVVRRASLFGLLLFVTVSAACGEPRVDPARVMDSTGSSHRWVCDAAGSCAAVSDAASPTLPECGTSAVNYGVGASPIGRICLFQDGNPIDCRPMVCTRDADCPFSALGPFTCEGAGVCRAPAGALRQVDVYALCAAAIPWASTCDEVLADPARAAAAAMAADGCAGSTCVVPDGCLQVE